MRLKRLLSIVAILLISVILPCAPALSWYWPIFGFGPGPCPPPSYDAVPSPILPGGFEWENIPAGPAHLVQPGYTYGLSAFLNGRLSFNRVPVFGLPAVAPGNVAAGNETTATTTAQAAGNQTNTTSTTGNATSITPAGGGTSGAVYSANGSVVNVPGFGDIYLDIPRKINFGNNTTRHK